MNSQEQTFWVAEAELLPKSPFVYLFTKVCCYLFQCYIISPINNPQARENPVIKAFWHLHRQQNIVMFNEMFLWLKSLDMLCEQVRQVSPFWNVWTFTLCFVDTGGFDTSVRLEANHRDQVKQGKEIPDRNYFKRAHRYNIFHCLFVFYLQTLIGQSVVIEGPKKPSIHTYEKSTFSPLNHT